jgi:hypothetical protein
LGMDGVLPSRGDKGPEQGILFCFNHEERGAGVAQERPLEAIEGATIRFGGIQSVHLAKGETANVSTCINDICTTTFIGHVPFH